MKSPNNYELAEIKDKVVQIRMIDILYNSNVSTLVYLRDITDLISNNRQSSDRPEEQNKSEMTIADLADNFLK